jgi:hypothetical protein
VSDKWRVITAGLGLNSQEEAAQRVICDAKKFNLFDDFILTLTRDLPTSAPTISRKYSDLLSPEVKGFGFFCWKPELVFRGFDERVDGVVWVDAGCEINANRLSRMRLKYFMQIARRQGYFVYKLDTPENLFTKRSLFKNFPKTSTSDSSGQIQATWLFLHGELGREIARIWLKTSLADISNLDLTNEGKLEAEGFVEHRFDQSVLSLTLKDLKCSPSNYRPPAGVTRLSQIRGVTHPIWSSRNRSGASIKNSLTKLFNYLFAC